MSTRQPTSLFAPRAAIATIAGRCCALPASLAPSLFLSLGLLSLLLLRAPRA